MHEEVHSLALRARIVPRIEECHVLASARWSLACLIAFSVLAGSSNAEPVVEATSHSRVGDGPLHAYVTSVSLPADGFWTVRAPEPAGSIRELYLTPTQPSRLRQLGKRMYAALEEKQTRYGRMQVRRGFEACRQYAQEHGNVGPKAIADLAKDKRWEYLTDRWDAPKYRSSDLGNFVDDAEQDGPHVHLIPEVQFDFAKPKPPEVGEKEADPKRTDSVADTPECSRRRPTRIGV